MAKRPKSSIPRYKRRRPRSGSLVGRVLGWIVKLIVALLIFSEITPKVVGAAHADKLAPLVSYVLSPMLQITRPIVWFTNLFVQGLLKLFRFRPGKEPGTTLTQEELRTLVLEGHSFRGKHRAVLANLA